MTDQTKNAKQNFEAAIVAGKDISKVLDLEPPINTAFESNARGGALTKARAEFADIVDAEIIEFCGTKDDEKYLILPVDIPNLASETQEYLKTVLPDEIKERLFPPVEKKVEKVKKEKVVNGKIVERREYIEKLIEEGIYTKQQIVEKTIVQFEGVTKSNLQTMLSDGKNAKYNRFSKLVVEDKDTKILSF